VSDWQTYPEGQDANDAYETLTNAIETTIPNQLAQLDLLSTQDF
jgi:hypothetical protein